jgi:DNA polymerase-3 subunit delta'
VILAQLRGQDRAVGLLRRALERRQLAHAYVFAGPPGVGKRTTALALAAATSCSSAPGVGCGSCPECHLIELGAHPDLLIEDLTTVPQGRTSGRAPGEPAPRTTRISIEQVHRVRQRLALQPVRASRKVGIIDQAELLSLEAQDALLKTLEEPPGTATLILVTVNADALLPTILSRCQRLVFAPLGDGVVAAILEAEGVDGEIARRAAGDAGGSLDLARTLATEEGQAARARLLVTLEALPRFGIAELLDLSRALADPEKFGRRPDPHADREIAELARSLALAGGATPILFPLLLRWLRGRVVEAADLDAARRQIGQLERVYATSRALAKNANAHLAWDDLVLGLRENW